MNYFVKEPIYFFHFHKSLKYYDSYSGKKEKGVYN